MPTSSILEVALHRNQFGVVQELLGETVGGLPAGTEAVSASALPQYKGVLEYLSRYGIR